MSKQTKYWGILLIVLILIVIGAYLSIRPYLEALKPVLVERSEETTKVIEKLKNADDNNDETGPFTVHEEFQLSVFSDLVINPRVLVEDSKGNILISEPSQSRISLLDQSGKPEVLIADLNRPHGIALLNNRLFIAETGQVIEYNYQNEKASNPRVLLDLPANGRHWTRTLGIGPDNNLYISAGSSCNICIEEDWRRTVILQYDFATEELKEYATGLRNAVFFNWNEETLLATEMGRDWLGDDLPPDELNMIEEGKDYGYPYCYGKNITDPEFNEPGQCGKAEPSLYDFIAHEAPLGIDFFNGDAIIALHGSWNRKEPVGYSVIRLTQESNYQDREEIFSGFLLEDGTSIGRPAGILVTSTNGILISDDKEDVIYKLSPR